MHVTRFVTQAHGMTVLLIQLTWCFFDVFRHFPNPLEIVTPCCEPFRPQPFPFLNKAHTLITDKYIRCAKLDFLLQESKYVAEGVGKGEGERVWLNLLQ